MKRFLGILLLSAGLSPFLGAAVLQFDILDLITVPTVDTDNDGFDNNGIWFTVTDPTPTVISDDSFPGYADGRFQLRTGDYLTDGAEFFVQGFWANGNDVALAGEGDFGFPAYIPFGTAVDGTLSYRSDQALAPLNGDFGNWINESPLRGALGLQFANSGNIHYGFADVTVNPDGTAILHGYAYESIPETAITTFVIPEPGTYALFSSLFVIGFFLLRRRRA